MEAGFKKLIDRLTQHKVDYVLVGGYAAMMQGSSLMTQDVDVACRMTSENLLKLHAALEDLHPCHRMSPQKPPFTKEEAAKSDWKNIYLKTDWAPLDCLGEIKGIGDFDACFQLSQILNLGDFTVRILTLDALLTAKKSLDRPKDRHAVLELEVIREKLRHKGA
ncbi:MAG: hypothetical protein ABI443_05170 [Chthoniobacterales bacterium]